MLFELSGADGEFLGSWVLARSGASPLQHKVPRDGSLAGVHTYLREGEDEEAIYDRKWRWCGEAGSVALVLGMWSACMAMLLGGWEACKTWWQARLWQLGGIKGSDGQTVRNKVRRAMRRWKRKSRELEDG